MKFTKITIPTAEEDTELLTSRLTDLGAEGFELGGGADLRELIDSADPDLIDEALIESLSAEEAAVTVYIPANEQGRAVLCEIESWLNGSGRDYTKSEVAEEDWENNWKAYFKPFEVGERLVIKPSWEKWEEYDNPGNRIVLEIDPASAFGTGQHATTRMCLELLESTTLTKGVCVLDIGCGSGILSAAAGLLGADYLVCVDIAENALKVTAETLERNYNGEIRLYCGDIIADDELRRQVTNEWVDVAVANITADVIVAMSDIFPQFDGMKTLILSGIIESRRSEVLAAVKKTFTVIEEREREGWCALVCRKKWYKRI
jgi:ribosomal protein L11 methyltransferase